MALKRESDLCKIANHVEVLNHEVGVLQLELSKLKVSMKWSVRIIGYMAILLTAMAGKTLFF